MRSTPTLVRVSIKFIMTLKFVYWEIIVYIRQSLTRFNNFFILNNRSQYVRISGIHRNHRFLVPSDVSQGKHFEPLLLLLFVTDILGMYNKICTMFNVWQVLDSFSQIQDDGLHLDKQF